jgi:predicted nuclease of predicted toxin-antitoxin system
MKFKIDENLPIELADRLTEAGFESSTIVAQGLGGLPDDDIFAKCCEEGRALITLDTDFADIRSYPPAKSPGIVVLRLGSRAKAHVLRVAAGLIDLLHRESVAKQLWVVEEHQVRIRSAE